MSAISPPFKRSALRGAVPFGAAGDACCTPAAGAGADTPPAGRAKLVELEPHLHCSVIGTCLGTAELRKLMARFVEVATASDLEVHQEAVRRAAEPGDATKAMHKALDQRHAASLRTFAAAHGEAALGAAWAEALQRGDVPGGYWALLTHRQVTPALRQRAFGDVHMLSHLVGAANRADLRRLVALEQEHAVLAERLEREQSRRQALVEERDGWVQRLQAQAVAEARSSAGVLPVVEHAREAESIALQVQRRERSEQRAEALQAERDRLQHELDSLRAHAQALERELAVAEDTLRCGAAEADGPAARLRGRVVLYVGGRPASTPAIRDLVVRQGGEFLHHDGGLEDRKGLLAAAVARAQWVVFPVDCVDHDSVLQVKRLSERHGVPFVPLRTASVASFAAALADRCRAENDASRVSL